MAAPRRPRRPLRFTLLAATMLAATLLAAAGCTPSGSASPGAGTAGPPASGGATVPSAVPAATFPIALTDDEGTEVVIESPPQRIVSLTPSSTEILFAIGAGDRVVAKVEDVASFPPESVDIPDVATFAGVDIEQIVDAEADLVISGGAGLTQGDAVEQLRRADIPVLVVYPTSVDGALAGIRLIGQAIGDPDAAADLADSMRGSIDGLASIAAGADSQPRVFYEIDVTGGIFTPPADSIYGEMLRLAGAEPISGNASYSISLEDLVDADPEVILLGDAAYGVTAAAVEARPGWEGMTAVEAGRIHPIDDIVVTRPGPRLVDGLVALIRAIHPALAEQLPPPEPAAAAPATLPAAA